MARKIDSEKCISCGACAAECPCDAITQGEGTYLINEKLCTDCGLCQPICPVSAINSNS